MRGRVLCAVLGCAAVAAAAAGWYAWKAREVPPPPAFALPEDDPELAEALAEAREAVLIRRREPTAWGELGMLLRASSMRAEAAACFEQAAALEPQTPRWPHLRGEALSQSEPAKAAESFREALARKEVDASLLRLAEVLLALGEADEAARLLRKIPEGAGPSPVARLLLGQAALAGDDPNEARRQLEKALDNPHTRKRATALLAAVHQRSGDGKRAAELEAKARALPQDQPWPDEYLSDCLRRARGRAVVLRQVEALEARREWGEAAALLRKLAERRADYNVLVGLGRNLARMNELRQAEQTLRRAVALEPGRAAAYLALAQVCVARKDYPQAEAEARRALERHGNDPAARLVLGRALAGQKKRSAAMAAYREALAISPDLGEAHLLLGEALAAEGDRPSARRHLTQAARLARPGDERAAKALKNLGD